MTVPKRFILIAWGSRGDLQPVAALARELRDAGREVLVFATPPATDLFDAQGIDCIVAEESTEEIVEQLFGRVDLADRSISGQLKLAESAQTMGEKLRSENGTANALSFIDEMSASFANPWPTAT